MVEAVLTVLLELPSDLPKKWVESNGDHQSTVSQLPSGSRTKPAQDITHQARTESDRPTRRAHRTNYLRIDAMTGYSIHIPVETPEPFNRLSAKRISESASCGVGPWVVHLDKLAFREQPFGARNTPCRAEWRSTQLDVDPHPGRGLGPRHRHAVTCAIISA